MHEAQLYLDAQMTRVQSLPLAGGQAVVFSTRCPSKATPNEDAAAVFAMDNNSAVLAVADGMGGGPAGEQASALAVIMLQEALKNGAASGDQLRTAILDGIDAANRKIQDAYPDSATTLAVVELQRGTIRPYHVGDSMVLAFGSRGRVKLQTVMHSPVGYAIEAGVLDPADAMHHKHRHVVSNIVGCPTMRVEMGSPLKLRVRDTVLLASDGLFDNLHIEEVVDRLRQSELADGVKQLAQEALNRMARATPPAPSKPDDLTIVAFRPGSATSRRRTRTSLSAGDTTTVAFGAHTPDTSPETL